MCGARPIRVLMVVPKYPYPVAGGLERQAHELATTLRRRGHTVHALSTTFASGQRELDVIDGVRVHRVPWYDAAVARFLGSPAGLARALWRLRDQIDVVHVHNISWFGAFVTIVASALGLPVLTKLPNIGDFGIPGMRQARLGALRVALLKGSRAIVAMTPDSVSELAAIAYPATRVLKVTNGIRLGPVEPRADRASPVDVVFVGRLSAQKGLADLVRAWAAVKARVHRRAVLRLHGDGPELGALRTLIAALDLGDVVELPGYCRDVPAVLARADVFVLPSHAEGNSNAVLEAMRAGLPIVATRVGGAACQVGEAGARFLVEVGDHQALAARLVELIDDAPARRRLGAAMRARVERTFDIERVASTYLQAYELLRSGRSDEVGRIDQELGADAR